VVIVQLKLLRVFEPAGLTVFISFLFSLFVHFVCSSRISVYALFMTVHCFIKAQLNYLVVMRSMSLFLHSTFDMTSRNDKANEDDSEPLQKNNIWR
jgi:hypothetical protein